MATTKLTLRTVSAEVQRTRNVFETTLLLSGGCSAIAYIIGVPGIVVLLGAFALGVYINRTA